MARKKYVYSSGEFAALNGINKRTLHYYNDIGLFRPAYRGKTATTITPAFSLPTWS